MQAYLLLNFLYLALFFPLPNGLMDMEIIMLFVTKHLIDDAIIYVMSSTMMNETKKMQSQGDRRLFNTKLL